ncbi:lecithin retinol acyltransferase family protein [Clostridium butyricum]
MRGEVIYVNRELYRHYGIDLGDSRVIHFSNDYDLDSDNAIISIVSRKNFSKGKKIEKCYRVNYKYESEEIVMRAMSKVGSDFGGYDVIYNNCEHFTSWCATGKKVSNQVFLKNDGEDVVEKLINRVFDPLLKIADKLF